MSTTRKEEFAELRRRAEALLNSGFEEQNALGATHSLPDLIHELEVHQVELEMQNEELLQTEQRLEASEKKFADLYNFAPVGYFTFDRKGTILDANLTGAGLLGVDCQVLSGKPFPAYCTPESADRFYLHVGRVLKTKQPEACELTLKRQGGSLFEAQLESVAAEDARGAFTLCQSALSDITERKRAELARVQLAAIVESSDDAIISKDLNGTILTWNRGATVLYGYSAEEMIGKPFSILAPPDQSDAIQLILRGIRNGEKFQHFETVRQGKDGRTIHVSLTISPIRDAAGRIMGASSIAQDITERKRAEAEQEVTIRLLQLINSSDSTSELIGNITRNIKDWSAVEAVGIRLRAGDDFPYYEHQGFPETFVQRESHLLTLDCDGKTVRDREGQPLMECMCGKIIRGQGDPARPYFTKHGSFWTNSTSGLVAGFSEAERLELGPLRMRCLLVGYESMALIPLHFRGQIVGLLQLVDKAQGRFTPRQVSFLENLADSIAIALAQRQAEAVLRELQRATAQSLALLDTLQTYAPIGFAFVDRDCRFVRINEELAAMNDLPVSAILGRSLAEVVPALWPQIEPNFQRVLTGEPILDIVISGETVARPGEWRHWQTSFYPVRVGGEEITGVGLIVLEITGRKQVEELLRRQGEQLKENDRRKNEFLSMMAHELRNPLAPIRNAVQILRLGTLDEHALKRQGEMIDRQVGHMARLLDDLLDVSRITQGKITLKNEQLDLRGVVERALETSASYIAEHGHRLHYDPLSEPIWLLGDGARLEQVICNLLNNAIKYTEPGGQIWVALQREASGDGPAQPRAALRIRDSGVGIAPDMLPLVFDLFTQAERSLDRSQGGLGIGLNLVRRLVELHGGTITAHSAGLGQGSEFVVRLPLRPESGAPATNPESREATAGGPDAIVAEGAARKILVVDDHVDETNSLGELLEKWGYRVRRAYDGAAVLAAALEFQPDVVLLDLGLPGLSGCEVAPLLRAQPALAATRIIALTIYGQEEDRRLSLSAGFDDHFTKPIDLKRLRGLLRRLLVP